MRRITTKGAFQRVQRLIRRPITGAELDAAMTEVDAAYMQVFGRHVDPVGAATYRDLISNRRLATHQMADLLRRSPEFLLNRSGFYHRLHASRSAWCADLPQWATILDIGGSSPTHELGALLELGYSHQPRELHILDRPEDDQFHGRPTYDQRVVRERDWGTVTFHHGHAGRLDEVPELGERSFDAVFMGQVIEHIAPHELEGMLRQIRAHLNPGGSFVLDTPNRALTSVVMGDQLLTADHTKEYLPDELATIIAHNGFTIDDVVGIHPMPQSRRTGKFDPYERPEQDPAEPDDCFCFAIHCRVG